MGPIEKRKILDILGIIIPSAGIGAGIFEINANLGKTEIVAR